MFSSPPIPDGKWMLAPSYTLTLECRTAQVKAQNFIQILIISVTIVVVAVPEGALPFSLLGSR